jgi:hypothetical protein
MPEPTGVGQPRIVNRIQTLAASQPAGADYLGRLAEATRRDLLQEAIRLYALDVDGMAKTRWLPFSVEALDLATRQLRLEYNEGMQQCFERLVGTDADVFARYYNVDRIPYAPCSEREVTFAFHDKANVARYAARIFLSPHYRTHLFVESARPPKQAFRGLYLEMLPAKVEKLRAAVTRLLKDGELTAPPTEYHTFRWKGTRVDVVSTEGVSDSPAGWLAEHLYVNANAVKASARAPLPESAAILESTLSEIAVSLGATRPTGPGEQAFRSWEEGASALLRYFNDRRTSKPTLALHWGVTLSLLFRAYLAEIRVRTCMTAVPVVGMYERYLQHSYVGVCLWEALSGERLPTPCLPNVIDIEVPADTVYCLKSERHRAEDAEYGFLVQEPKYRLMGTLKGFLEVAEQSVFVPPPPDVQPTPELATTLEGVEATLASFVARPLIVGISRPSGRQRQTKRAVRRPPAPPVFEAITIAEFPGRVTHRSPLMLRGASPDVRVAVEGRPNFYALTQVNPNPVSLLNFGNSFSTQLCFHIAAQLLQRVSREFQLDDSYAEKRLQFSEADLRKVRKELRQLKRNTPAGYRSFLIKRLELQRMVQTNRFFLTAGSNVHGGSFPPHKTHREGRHFDISMGPDLTPWRTTGLREVLIESLNVLNNDFVPAAIRRQLETSNPFVRRDGKTKVSTIYLVEQGSQDIGRAVPIVDHDFMLNRIDRAEEHARDGDSGTIDSVIGSLAGTPHFVTPDDAELPHIGTLCFILSFPEQIIYASPIAYLRCLASLRSALNELDGEDLFLAAVLKGETISSVLTKLLEELDFAFLPSDHHHHWHVDYHDLETALGRLEMAMPMWLFLDVDLEPFAVYLRGYRKYLLDTTLPESQQLEAVLDYCHRYKKMLDSRRSEGGSALRLSQRFLRRAFVPHVRNARLEALEEDELESVGMALDPVAGEPLHPDIQRRSTRIKGYLALLREALRRENQRSPNPEAAELMDRISAAVGFDADAPEAEGDPKDSNPGEGPYDRWQFLDAPWI